MLRLGALLAFAGLLSGCSVANDDGQQAPVEESQAEKTYEVSENAIRIIISVDDGREYIDEKEIAVGKGDNRVDVMQEKFYVETNSSRNHITSIDGVAQEESEEKTWVYFINDEITSEGVREVALTPDDQITWDLQGK